jgi:hypothetical protein
MNGTAEEILRTTFREKMGREEDEDDVDVKVTVGGKRKIAPVDNGPMDKFLKKSKKS